MPKKFHYDISKLLLKNTIYNTVITIYNKVITSIVKGPYSLFIISNNVIHDSVNDRTLLNIYNLQIIEAW